VYLIQHFKLALANLSMSKLRALLAMLGILVGTASVVALISSGNLATQQTLAQLQVLGTDLLSLTLFNSSTTPSSASTATLDLNTAQNTKRSNTSIAAVAPYIGVYAPMSYRGHVLNGSIIGSTEDLQHTIKIHLLSGRFISFLDHYAFYCVIGNGVYQNLLAISPDNPLGKQILINNTIFTIIGIADVWPQNSFFDQDVNQAIIVPLETTYLLDSSSQINSMVFQLYKNADIDSVEAAINNYLTPKVPGKKLFFRSAKQLIQSMQRQREILTLLLGLIGSISLIVGGIGIMNIMLVSVVERRREIGIRRALGARQKDIQLMFLAEALILSIIGGILGVLLGVIASSIIAKFAHWQFSIFFMPALLGFTVSVFVGIFFGFYPAYQASRLNPIETLHAE
jgi:putative ABC transport system permease protein